MSDTIFPLTEKLCPSCKVIRPASDFYRNSMYPGGLKTPCKPCDKNKHAQKNYPPDITISFVKCTGCRQLKHISKFYVNKRKRNGYNPYCIECGCKQQGTFTRRCKLWKRNAKLRNKKWLLTEDYLKALPQVCHYIGVPLTCEINHYNTISLDRVDNSKGYTEDNVVFCCQFINKMKQDLTYDQFICTCKMIAQHRASKLESVTYNSLLL